MYKLSKFITQALFTPLIIFALSGNSAQSVRQEWIKPVEGTIPNPFGNGYNFYGYYRAGHTGIDIKTDIGTPVLAVKSGVIRYIRTKPNMRYGYYIVIEHNDGLHTLYGHLQKILVHLNQKVNQGDVIATSGISGLASFPHLHFEITDKTPIKDGAWGYNYICKMERETKLTKKTSNDMFRQNFNFLNAFQKQFSCFYRMKKKHCIEEPISPITYFNPELFLPHYEHSSLPDFIQIPHTKKRINIFQTKLNVTKEKIHG